jgi:hypothetical protein
MLIKQMQPQERQHNAGGSRDAGPDCSPETG